MDKLHFNFLQVDSKIVLGQTVNLFKILIFSLFEGKSELKITLPTY